MKNLTKTEKKLKRNKEKEEIASLMRTAILTMVMVAFFGITAIYGLYSAAKTPARVYVENYENVAEVYEIPEATFPCYAYETLPDEYRPIYNSLLAGIWNMADTIFINDSDTGKIEEIYRYVMADHPELFYIKNIGILLVHAERSEYCQVHFTYEKSAEEVKQARIRIEEAAQEILKGLPKNADEYTMAKYVYEYIIRNTDYVLDSPDNQNLLSVLLNHESVCAGYAKAYQYLLQKCGMTVAYVVSEDHAWNLVRVNGCYYYVDTTWGDAAGKDAAFYGPNYINYKYLLVTDKEMDLNHHKSVPNIPLPLCETTRDNYYIREGLYFTQPDYDRLAGIFDYCIARSKVFSVRFANDETFDEVRMHMQYVTHNQGLYHPEYNFHYRVDEEARIITIIL